MMGPRPFVDYSRLKDQTYEALLDNKMDQVYLGARQILRSVEGQEAGHEQEIEHAHNFACQLAFTPSHRLHGYDLLYRCAMVGELYPKSDQALSDAKDTLRAHLLQHEREPLNSFADRKKFRSCLNLVSALGDYEAHWEGDHLLLAAPLEAGDVLVLHGAAWFDDTGRSSAALKQINERLAEASTFLAVNGTGDERGFDAQPLFLWGRLMRMAIPQNKRAAYDLAVDAMMIAWKGIIPVGCENEPNPADLGRERSKIRANSGPCLFQAARGLVHTL